MFARLERPIPFDALDDRPVDLVFALLAPADAGAEHLRALARVSRLLRDDAIRQKLRGTDNPDALYALLTDRSESHATSRRRPAVLVAAQHGGADPVIVEEPVRLHHRVPPFGEAEKRRRQTQQMAQQQPRAAPDIVAIRPPDIDDFGG